MGRDHEKAKPATDPKEAKLAEALRANLRRRKAAARGTAPASTPDKSSTS